MSALTAYAREYDANPLFRYLHGRPGKGGMSAGQRRFHTHQTRLRALRASNQVGKTWAGAAEEWWHLLGEHPFRAVRPAPNEGWVIIPDLENDWQKISATMRSLEPPDMLAPGCRYDEAIGYTYRSKRMIMLRNRSALYPKSGTQAILALAGRPIDHIWLDEPPKRSHWSEALARVATKFAPVWLTFTPIGRPLGWLRTIMEGNAEEDIAPNPEWVGNQIVIQLSYENAPHRTRQSIDSQIANCDAWEIGQRIRAEWDGVTQGRRFGSFTEGCILSDEDLPATFEELRVHWDHGETEGSQVGYISARNGRRMYLLREVVGAAHSTPHEDAQAMIDALAGLGLTPMHVSRAFGDINSAGKLGAGGKVNAFLEAAFADILRMVAPPFEIERPPKGAGSVKMGEKAMNHAMKEGRWFVHDRCHKFIHSAKHYTGVEQDLKHPVDASRYGWGDLLLSVPAKPGAGITLVG